ncbi:hypothetical protein ACUTAF_16770 [Pseudomonas sp. SP16.1]|uniref:hypothetical protein n=1 Tax=Pseudomonas sp. SP16.1 TaxID=3458854 RepID=UPI004045CBFC
MPHLLALLLLLICPALLAGELDGHYHATLDGQPAELLLHSQGQRVEGRYVENRRLQLNLRGHYDGQLLRAEISDPQSGLVLANMNATYANAMLNISIAARDPRDGQVLERQALFRRDAAPAPVANEHLDPALVGTWQHEQRIDSGAASATLMTLRLDADGSVTQWSRAPDGGDSPGEVQYSGRWRSDNGLLLVRLAGAAEYRPAAYYSFSEPYLVTESNTGKMIWQRSR